MLTVSFIPFRRTLVALFAGCCLALYGCGYGLDGFESHGSHAQSVLGDGSGTLKIESIEHVTLYPWIPYYIRSVLRDEVNLRRLGRWVDQGDADYLVSVSLPGYRVRSSVSNREDSTLLYNTNIQLEIIIKDGRSGSIVWRSGVISYQDKYATVDDEAVIRDGVTQTMRRALDRMQQKF
ncbi:MAG: hypothetical protein J6I40_00780 [Mailhella sp.]|nr:hypothetical protein [Mailhella sp.]